VYPHSSWSLDREICGLAEELQEEPLDEAGTANNPRKPASPRRQRLDSAPAWAPAAEFESAGRPGKPTGMPAGFCLYS
jgi:hypothetical protein